MSTYIYLLIFSFFITSSVFHLLYLYRCDWSLQLHCDGHWLRLLCHDLHVSGKIMSLLIGHFYFWTYYNPGHGSILHLCPQKILLNSAERFGWRCRHHRKNVNSSGWTNWWCKPWFWQDQAGGMWVWEGKGDQHWCWQDSWS